MHGSCSRRSARRRHGQHNSSKRAASATEGSEHASDSRSGRRESNIAAAVWHASPACAARAKRRGLRASRCPLAGQRACSTPQAWRLRRRSASSALSRSAAARKTPADVARMLCTRRAGLRRAAASSTARLPPQRAVQQSLRCKPQCRTRSERGARRTPATPCRRQLQQPHTAPHAYPAPPPAQRRHRAAARQRRGSCTLASASAPPRLSLRRHTAGHVQLAHTSRHAQRRISSCASASPGGAGDASSRGDAATEQSRTDCMPRRRRTPAHARST